MEAAIDYLNLVHGDLLAAAERERSSRVSPGRPGRSRRGLAAAAVAILVAAGGVGWLAQNPDVLRRAGSDASGGGAESVPASAPAGQATGATGAVNEKGASIGNVDSNDQRLGAQHLEPGVVASPTPGPPSNGQPGVTARVIRTADLTVVIPRDAFEQRFGTAADIAERNHGYVADSQSRDRSGSLTIRVPSRNFERTLRALRDLGRVDVQSIHGQDVTADYVDLRARLDIARSRRDVLLRLMQKATSIEQTIRVQNALDETQLRIEQIQGQLRVLNDQTSLATITLSLREQGVAPPDRVEKPSIPNAFERAVAGFVGVVAAIVIGLGYLLPIGLIALVWWLVALALRRRRERG
jgi:hypothetical protein